MWVVLVRAAVIPGVYIRACRMGLWSASTPDGPASATFTLPFSAGSPLSRLPNRSDRARETPGRQAVHLATKPPNSAP